MCNVCLCVFNLCVLVCVCLTCLFAGAQGHCGVQRRAGAYVTLFLHCIFVTLYSCTEQIGAWRPVPSCLHSSMKSTWKPCAVLPMHRSRPRTPSPETAHSRAWCTRLLESPPRIYISKWSFKPCINCVPVIRSLKHAMLNTSYSLCTHTQTNFQTSRCTRAAAATPSHLWPEPYDL